MKRDYILKFNDILSKHKFMFEMELEEKERDYDSSEIELYWKVINSGLEVFEQNSFEKINLKLNILCFSSIVSALKENKCFLTIGKINVPDKQVMPCISEGEYTYIKEKSIGEDNFLVNIFNKNIHAWITTLDGYILDISIVNFLEMFNEENLDLLITPLHFLDKEHIEYIPYDIIVNENLMSDKISTENIFFDVKNYLEELKLI